MSEDKIKKWYDEMTVDDIYENVQIVAFNSKYADKNDVSVECDNVPDVTFQFRIFHSEGDKHICAHLSYAMAAHYNLDATKLFLTASLNNIQKMKYARITKFVGIKDDNCPFYVVTNDQHYYGAGVIAGIGAADALKAIVEEDEFVLLPISIHEVIIAPISVVDFDNKESVAELSTMVAKANKELNDAGIMPEEHVLSDKVYIYRNGKYEVLEVA